MLSNNIRRSRVRSWVPRTLLVGSVAGMVVFGQLPSASAAAPGENGDGLGYFDTFNLAGSVGAVMSGGRGYTTTGEWAVNNALARGNLISGKYGGGGVHQNPTITIPVKPGDREITAKMVWDRWDNQGSLARGAVGCAFTHGTTTGGCIDYETENLILRLNGSDIYKVSVAGKLNRSRPDVDKTSQSVQNLDTLSVRYLNGSMQITLNGKTYITKKVTAPTVNTAGIGTIAARSINYTPLNGVLYHQFIVKEAPKGKAKLDATLEVVNDDDGDGKVGPGEKVRATYTVHNQSNYHWSTYPTSRGGTSFNASAGLPPGASWTVNGSPVTASTRINKGSSAVFTAEWLPTEEDLKQSKISVNPAFSWPKNDWDDPSTQSLRRSSAISTVLRVDAPKLVVDATATVEKGEGNTEENVAEADDTVALNYNVKNEGTAPSGAIKLVHPRLNTPLAYAQGLIVNGSTDIPSSIEVTQDDVDAGPNSELLESLPENFTIEGVDASGEELTSSELVKGKNTMVPKTTTATMDVEPVEGNPTTTDTNNNGVIDAGDTVVFEFDMTNTGGLSLKNRAVEVDIDGTRVDAEPTVQGGNGIQVASTTGTDPERLFPDASETYTVEATPITTTHMQSGRIVATATGSATRPYDTTKATGELTATAELPLAVETPAISMVKTSDLTGDTDNDKRFDVGDEITYSFSVTNEGKIGLSLGSINIDDKMLSDANIGITLTKVTNTNGEDITEEAKAADRLQAGQVATFTAAPYKIPADRDGADTAGSGFANTASAKAMTAEETPREVASDTSGPGSTNIVNLDANPSLGEGENGLRAEIIEPEATRDGKANVGETLIWKVTAPNTGDVALVDPLATVTEGSPSVKLTRGNDLNGEGQEVPDSATTDLARGESATFSGTYAVTAADVAAAKDLSFGSIVSATPKFDGAEQITAGPATVAIPVDAANNTDNGDPAKGGVDNGDPAKGGVDNGDPAKGGVDNGDPAKGGVDNGDPAKGGVDNGDPAKGGVDSTKIDAGEVSTPSDVTLNVLLAALATLIAGASLGVRRKVTQ